jgi:regulator of sigma E protease
MLVALAIVALGLLIVVHEAGHYFVARWSKMKVERFSIGFGPALVKWHHKGTQFQLAPLPLGGFVQIVGMNPHEEFDERDPTVYPNRPAILRFLTIFAGPGMNYLFASLLIFIVSWIAGVPTGTAWQRVKNVLPDAPAAGKLEPGDRIVKVNGVPVYYAHAKDPEAPGFSSQVAKAKGAPVMVTVNRDGKDVDVQITPRVTDDRSFVIAMKHMVQSASVPLGGKVDPVPTSFKVGIMLEADEERADVGVGRAAYEAARYPVVMTVNLLTGLYKIITGQVEGDVHGAPAVVAEMSNQFEYGWVRAFEFVAMLSLYLGLFNLLPIPGLDGGRLAFLTYELTTRRRPNPKVEATVHMVGFVLLFLLVIIVTLKDIRNLLFT